jgi:hypothetical protein
VLQICVDRSFICIIEKFCDVLNFSIIQTILKGILFYLFCVFLYLLWSHHCLSSLSVCLFSCYFVLLSFFIVFCFVFCLSIFIGIFLSVSLSVCLPVVSFYLFVFPSFCLSVSLSFFIFPLCFNFDGTFGSQKVSHNFTQWKDNTVFLSFYVFLFLCLIIFLFIGM